MSTVATRPSHLPTTYSSRVIGRARIASVMPDSTSAEMAGEAAKTALAGYGQVDDEGDWLVVRGIDDERVPELVAHIVRLGGRVYAVEPRHESLEDRFLRLLGQPN
jgi:3-oxoacyl-[acyl-carrier-protein] synthase III